jgi:hypothetical protein
MYGRALIDGRLESSDPAAAALRILTAPRLGPRKRAALVLVLEGVGYRAAARAVGLADHMALHRAASRMGLQLVHNRRAQYREAMRKIAVARDLLRCRERRSTVRESIRACSLATDAFVALHSGAHD